MRYKITGRNINVTPGLKAAVEEKIGKLERYFNQDTEVNITLTVEKDRQKIEVTIPVKGTIIRAEQEIDDHRRQLQCKGCDKSERYRITPHIDRIADQSELRISAGTEYSGDQRRIHGSAHNIISINEQHIFQIMHGSVIQCSKP